MIVDALIKSTRGSETRIATQALSLTKAEAKVDERLITLRLKCRNQRQNHISQMSFLADQSIACRIFERTEKQLITSRQGNSVMFRGDHIRQS